MKKFLMFLLMLIFLALAWGGYHYYMRTQVQKQINAFIENAAEQKIDISVGKILVTHDFANIHISLTNIQINAFEMEYKNPHAEAGLSLFVPFSINIILDGNHMLNGNLMTSDPIEIETDYRLDGQIEQFKTGIHHLQNAPYGISDIVLTFHQTGRNAFLIEELKINTQNASAVLTGFLNETEAELSATVIGFAHIIKMLQQEQIIPPKTANQLTLMGGFMNGPMTVPIEYKNETFFLMGFPIK